MDTNNEPLDEDHFQPGPDAEYQGMVQDDLTTRLRSVAYWFYWIVGFSLINTIMVSAGANLAFSLGLGITQIVDIVALDFQAIDDSSGFQYIAWAVDVMILGFFVFLGFALARRMAWALWCGVILYGLDSLFFLAGSQWISFAFHVFVLYKLSRGFAVLKEARQIAIAQDRV